MKLSRIGRVSMALVVSVAMGLGMTACGGGTVAFLWVLGAQYNQIAGFKVDHFSGNLTPVVGSPFSSNGTNPTSIAVTPGGRYVYIVNKGIPASGTTAATPGNIALLTVGGDGVLTFQQSYTSRGNTPVWATVDGSGSFLYVLDSHYPDTPEYPNPNNLGAITVFSIDSTTGRLQLVPNQQVKDSNQTQLTFFPVGPAPTMMRVSGTSCLFTINTGDQTVTPYASGANGQLTITANQSIATGAGQLTSITANGSYVYLTDAAPTADSPGGRVFPYTVGTGSGACSLNTLTGGPVNNLPKTSNPVYGMVDNKGKALYVLNRSSTDPNNQSSSISAFSIDPTTGKLQFLGTGNNVPYAANPYSVGSGPVCMIEDPSNQWAYTSNNIAGNITGKRLNSNSSELSDLPRGNSTFPTVGQPTCMALTGSIN